MNLSAPHSSAAGANQKEKEELMREKIGKLIANYEKERIKNLIANYEKERILSAKNAPLS